MHDDQAALEARLLHRMVFFTDAVFAIVVTLLVLELKPPESWREANVQTLAHAAPHIAAFAFSFLIISVFWVAHMAGMRRLARFDWPTAVANLAFLFPVSLLAYVTAWLGADPGGATTWVIYSWVLIATSAANVVMVLVSHRDGGRLLAGGSPPGERAYRLTRAAAPGVSFLIGLAMVAAGLVIPAHFCCLLIPVIFWLANAVIRRRPQPAPEAEAA